MKSTSRHLTYIPFTILALILSVGVSRAQNPYRVTDKEVASIINKLDHETDNFRGEVGHALDKSSIDGTKREDRIKDFVSDFEKSTDKLHDSFNHHNSAAAQVEDVLLKGRAINRFMRSHDLGSKANGHWASVRSYLDTLAGYYSVAVWDWNAEDPWPVEP